MIKIKMNLVKIITKQTEILFKNLRDQLEGAELERMLDNVNNSRFLFHALHSLDRYFINPQKYEYEAGEKIGIEERYSIISEEREGYVEADGYVIPRETLLAYYDFVEAKIFDYLHNLKDEELTQKPKGCEHTKLALSLGQFRHLMFHLGLSEAVTFEVKGEWLAYTGFSYISKNY